MLKQNRGYEDSALYLWYNMQIMRYFTHLYFDGAGNGHDRYLVDPKQRDEYLKANPDARHSCSWTMANLLHQRLDEALSTLSGIQQGGCTESEMKEADRELEDIVRDFAAALTDMEIKFKRNLPPPSYLGSNLENCNYDEIVNKIYKYHKDAKYKMGIKNTEEDM